MTAAISIRRGMVKDAAALASFATRAFTDTYEAFNTPENMRTYLAGAYGESRQERELEDPAMVTLIAEADRELVGFVQLRQKETPPCVTHDDPVEIYRFYVDRRAHGTGVAQTLMIAAMNGARALGGRHLWLGVWERNPRAIAFYLKSGFIDVGTQIFTLGSDDQNDRVLVLPLHP